MPHKGTLFVYRPHTLLTNLGKHPEFLTYLYPETGEQVIVANNALNQPFWYRAQLLLEEAASSRELAAGHEAAGADYEALCLRKRAGHREAAARWLLAYGDPIRPVEAVQA